ncbi:alpha/beta fold hydrolase [Streptomyces sp. NPDC057638]|uniref:alpha/beta fold hydrolase n=1 Tax=Streptomyces sp. NPDC057638 TaxID=3346190 RepID=UPI0036A33466
MRRTAQALRRLLHTALEPPTLTRAQALSRSERLSALTTLSSSLEHLAQRHQTEPGGLNDWHVLREAGPTPGPLLRRLLDRVAEPRTTTALHLGRAALATALLAPGDGRWRGAAQLCLATSGALLFPRHAYGTDGSDQVTVMVQGATGAARLVRAEPAKDALVWYLAAQANLSYLVSGWVKLIGPAWRDGSALPGVLRTRVHGHPRLWALAREHPRTSRLLAHSVLALECGFPLLYTRGGRLTRPVVSAAVLFHGANAYALGLNRFLTAFTSLHPLVAYTAVPKTHPVGARRDDRFRTLAAAALTTATAFTAVAAVRRRAAVLAGSPGSRLLVARSGNLLQYEHHGDGDPDQPVLVLGTGLAATPDHLARISERLAVTTRFGVLGYARAGYNGSRRRATGPYTLAESARDLVDLVEARVCPGRPVILVGHALGAEVARRAAPLLGDRVEGIVYLDPCHPAELLRSERKSRAAVEQTRNLTRMAWFLRLGTGALLSPLDWATGLPGPVRRRIHQQHADSRMWWAALREWRAMEEEFQRHTGELPPVPGRALVISAQVTADGDPDQIPLHHELARAHRAGGECVVLDGAAHDGMLTRPGPARETTRLITEFAAATRPAHPHPAGART